MDTVISIEHVQKEYRLDEVVIPVLHDIQLEIREGEYVALMGPSGSGKSTLMNIIGCLDVVTSGRYFLHTIEVSSLDKDALAHVRSEKIGFVFQTFNLLPRETAIENVMVPMVYRKTNENRHKKALLALEAVGLKHRIDHLPAKMSGGEKQRVAIARALINDPAIILADEPTGNLDSKSGAQILEIFKDLHQQNRTIIMVTHDPAIAERADRIIHLKDGRIIEQSKKRKIRSVSGKQH